MNHIIDILCVGEVLIDCIGLQNDAEIHQTTDYHRYLGGSPTNVAINSAKLGLNTMLVATVGNDGFGEYIFEELERAGVNTSSINTIENKPTSVVFVSKSKVTPDFIPYREADRFISETQLSKGTLKQTKIFHTTCFALSKTPAQTLILQKAETAFNLGCKLSIDINYSDKLWDNKTLAIKIIKAYCKFNPLVKISDDDMFRFFGEKLTPEAIFNFFHTEGVDVVCLTLGSKGVMLSQKNKKIIELPAIKIEKIKDVTGAGDAFWSGFLYAYIHEKSMNACLEMALNLAALKLQNVGQLPEHVSVTSLLR